MWDITGLISMSLYLITTVSETPMNGVTVYPYFTYVVLLLKPERRSGGEIRHVVVSRVSHNPAPTILILTYV